MDVLVVDADAGTRARLGALVSARGWTVREAHTAGDALLQIADHRPDLLLLDPLLPRRDGLDLLRLLDRGLGRPRHVVLVGRLPNATLGAIARGAGLPFLPEPYTGEGLDAVLELGVAPSA